MNGWLIDTNVISELRKPQPNARVVAFIADQALERLFISSVTFAELRFGIEQVKDASKRADLIAWLANIVRPMFDQRVLEVTEQVMFRWRLLVEEGRKVGHTFSQPDLIIAATAVQHGSQIVTRDVSDFQKAGAPVFDPWTYQQLA